VLVIAVDPSIESLMGQLVAFAGHRPVFDPTMGAGGETIRRIRPDVVMLDVSLPPPIVDACLAGADEAGTRPVLTSSATSSRELAEEARARHALHFALPGGPRPLADVIDRAIDDRHSRPQVTVPVPRGDGTVHRALCAALAGVARDHVLRMRLEALKQDRQSSHMEDPVSPEEAQNSRKAVKAAVTDYARQLKSSRTPESSAIVQVRTAICDCASVVGAEEATQSLMVDCEHWTRDAYGTATSSPSADAAP
jgi:chemotaxis response regulator CheB